MEEITKIFYTQKNAEFISTSDLNEGRLKEPNISQLQMLQENMLFIPLLLL